MLHCDLIFVGQDVSAELPILHPAMSAELPVLHPAPRKLDDNAKHANNYPPLTPTIKCLKNCQQVKKNKT